MRYGVTAKLCMRLRTYTGQHVLVHDKTDSKAGGWGQREGRGGVGEKED